MQLEIKTRNCFEQDYLITCNKRSSLAGLRVSLYWRNGNFMRNVDIARIPFDSRTYRQYMHYRAGFAVLVHAQIDCIFKVIDLLEVIETRDFANSKSDSI